MTSVRCGGRAPTDVMLVSVGSARGARVLILAPVPRSSRAAPLGRPPRRPPDARATARRPPPAPAAACRLPPATLRLRYLRNDTPRYHRHRRLFAVKLKN